MPIEVELKARLADPDTTIARLRDRATGQTSMYRDTYYDWPDQRLERSGRQELRLRVIQAIDSTRCLLTFKGAMLDAARTPEYETAVGDADAAHAILTGLGLRPTIRYTKQCENFQLDHDSRAILATVVRIPEIEGTFLELETVIPDDGDGVLARESVVAVLADLGLGDDDLEPTFYIDLVSSTRARFDGSASTPA